MMAKISEKFRQHPIAWFFVLAVFIEIIVMGTVLLTGGDEKLGAALEISGLPLKTDYVSALRLVLAIPSIAPVLVLLILQPLTPTIAAFFITSTAFKPSGIKQLIAGYRFWSQETGWHSRLKSWGLCLGTFAAMSLVTAGLNHYWLPERDFTWKLNILSLQFIFSFLVAMFLDIGAVGEETGWRGFVLPVLQKQMSPLRASLLLGILWSFWHIPAKPDLVLNDFSYFLLFFGSFAVRLTALSILMTYFYNRVGGSTLIAITMHGLHNDSVGLQGQILSDSDQVFFITEINLLLPILMAAGIVLLISKSRLGNLENNSIQAESPNALQS